VQHHARAVDVTDLQVARFADAKPAAPRLDSIRRYLNAERMQTRLATRARSFWTVCSARRILDEGEQIMRTSARFAGHLPALPPIWRSLQVLRMDGSHAWARATIRRAEDRIRERSVGGTDVTQIQLRTCAPLDSD
jgi:hypothetical protein